jgi:hypothetical protein
MVYAIPNRVYLLLHYIDLVSRLPETDEICAPGTLPTIAWSSVQQEFAHLSQ